MKALKPLSKAMPKLIRILAKQFGVNIIVYAPISLDSMYGGKGSSIEYNPEPIVEGKFLIPSLVKGRPTGSDSMIDPFLDDSQILYTDASIIIPNYSKIEVVIDGHAPVLFRTDIPIVIKDDKYIFIRKYPLIPISDMVSHSFSDITLEELLEIETEIQEEFPEVRETITTETTQQKFTYSPIEG